MQCIVYWWPKRPGSGGLQPPSAGPAFNRSIGVIS